VQKFLFRRGFKPVQNGVTKFKIWWGY
jgi:hypothetical protein